VFRKFTKNFLVALTCLMFMLATVARAEDEPELVSANLPKYPGLARQAGVYGTVKLMFTLPAKGNEPTDIGIESGHALLNEAAKENVRSWHFRNGYTVARKYQVAFDYELRNTTRSITFESFHKITIIAPEPLQPKSNF